MNYALEQKLWIAGQTSQAYEQEIWSNIVESLLDDLENFIGQSFDKDEQITLYIKNSYSPSFVIWIWRNEEEISNSNAVLSEDNYEKEQLISTVWSGVMAGSIVGSNENGLIKEIFSVRLTLFLFDPISKDRVYLETGESIMEFAYKKSFDGCGSWVNLGWEKDIYGEWKDIEYE